ncbi:hypothetical protein T07_9517 [Trichinella nelsoni]|uniref:Uncharacterized protein n=1 Tax=Trichinella nelsoni TaxID=6336 RepID=A0A0V0S6C1_9BILA|nr:hypothetical protein T07_9517 [Trichinella nelsoni]
MADTQVLALRPQAEAPPIHKERTLRNTDWLEADRTRKTEVRIRTLYTLQLSVTPIDYQCKEQNNDVDWFFVYKLPGGKSSHHLLPNAATDWSAVETIDDQQKPMHSTMNIYIGSGNKANTNIVAYSNYPPHFKFELPMTLAIGDLFSNEKTTKEAAAFLCMSYSDLNLRAIAKIIDYEQPIVFFAQKSATVPAFYDSTEVQKLVNGLHKYQPTASASGDGVATLTQPGTVKIFASAPVAYSSDIYSNYVVKILQKSFQVYTPGTTATVLRKSCVGTLKVENVLGPITVKDTVIPIGQDSARWSVPKSDSDFICLSNTGRTANDAKYGASVACVLSKEAADLFRKMITKENLDAFYTPGTTATVLRKSCVGTLKVENVLGPITVKDTVIPKGEDSARWSVPKSDSDFICLSNTGRTANDAKYGATVACVLNKDAADLFRKMITKENLDACP